MAPRPTKATCLFRRDSVPPLLRQEVQLQGVHDERRGHAQAARHVHHQGAGGGGGQGRLPEVLGEGLPRGEGGGQGTYLPQAVRELPGMRKAALLQVIDNGTTTDTSRRDFESYERNKLKGKICDLYVEYTL